jgi:uncharacterized membrane protein YeiH
VGTAVITSIVYIVAYEAGLSIWPATLIAFVIGFSFRFTARRLHWEEPLPKQADGAVVLSS